MLWLVSEGEIQYRYISQDIDESKQNPRAGRA
jgi:hypothetical protein